MNNDVSTEDRLYFLRLFSDFDESSDNGEIIKFTFETHDSENCKALNKKYDLKKIMGAGDSITQISNLKKWVSGNLFFRGEQIMQNEFDNTDCLELVDRIKESGHAMNCRYIALFFTQILLSAGFKARLVSCVPMELDYYNCHWVTEVYINELNKWIIADAAYNLFYFNKNGEPLNLLELRKMIIASEKIRFVSSDSIYHSGVMDCWIAFCFRFKFILNNKYNMLSDGNKFFMCLNPSNFKISDKKISGDKSRPHGLKFYYDSKLFWG